MPVPSAISDLSQTAASNSPPGSESPTTADDYLRTYASFIALLRDGKGFTDPVTLASATTTDIGGENAMFVEISGTTTITSFGTNYNGPRFLRFTGALTLTHNATTLNLPNAANITTAAGDTCIAVPNITPNGWNVYAYQKASGVGTYTVGTAANNLVQLNSSAQLPAVDGSLLTGIGATQIQPISASVGSNALTISASALALDFRSTTLGSGTVTRVSGTPSDLVISSGSTLGTASGIQSDIAVLAINNAGTIELASVNMYGGVDLSETGLISTTAEGGAGGADSASTIYSTTARTNVAYRVIGILRSTQATAGTWATAPSLIQGIGGRAITTQMAISVQQATTSGSAIEFTGIPAWVKRITLTFSGVSTNGTSVPIVQLGTSGGPVTSGYLGAASIIAGTVSSANNTVGMGLAPSWGAAIAINGSMIITLMNPNTGLWVGSSVVGDSGAANTFVGGSSIALSGTLDRLRFKPQNGTDSFDAGSVNILFEG